MKEFAHPHVELRAPPFPNNVEGAEKTSPFVVGSNVPVRRIYDWFRRGVPAETLIKRYPALGPAKVLSALAYAHDNKELVEKDIEQAERVMSEGTLPPPPQTPLRF